MTAGHVSRRLGLAVAAFAVIALGFTVGEVFVPVGVAGALVLAWGLSALRAASNSHVGGGSVAVVAGALAIGGTGMLSAGGASMVVVLLGSAAVLFASLVALGDAAGEWLLPARPVFLFGGLAAIFVGVLSLLAHGLYSLWLAPAGYVGGIRAAWEISVGASSDSPLVAFVSLQVVVLAVVFLFPVGRRIVANWLGGELSQSMDSIGDVPFDLERIPHAYWVALGGQLFVLLLPGDSNLLAWVLSSLWVLGSAIRFVLVSGLVHAPLALFVLFLGAIVVAELLRRLVRSALGARPGRRLALTAGGIAFGVVLFVGSAGWFVLLGNSLPAVNAGFGSGFGVGAALNVTLAFVLFGLLAVVWVPCWYVANHGSGSSAIMFASAGVFGTAIAVEIAGGPPLAVFGGVAASVVTWDLASTGMDFSSHLGTHAETRRAEVVHATGTLAVAVAGIVLAGAAIYLVGPLPVPGDRAAAAVVLALFGVVGLFAGLPDRDETAE